MTTILFIYFICVFFEIGWLWESLRYTKLKWGANSFNIVIAPIMVIIHIGIFVARVSIYCFKQPYNTNN